MKINEVYEGDCLDVMREFPDNCIDSIITDPPYGLEFMGKNWDHGIPGVAYWREALRIAKPGATLMAFGGSRTYHRLVCAIEDAGWEIRDCIMWVYGSGFPKSANISKQLDKAAIVDCPECFGSGVIAIDWDSDDMVNCNCCGGSGKVKGAEREVVGRKQNLHSRGGMNLPNGWKRPWMNDENKRILAEMETTPATPLAAKFNGYGTALKPAHEPIVVAMKPIDQSFAANAEKWGVSGLWIDGGRVEYRNGKTPDEEQHKYEGKGGTPTAYFGNVTYDSQNPSDPKGRWPANVIHSGEPEVLAEFDKAGVRVSTGGQKSLGAFRNGDVYGKGKDIREKGDPGLGDSGSAARFFAQCPPDPTAHPEAARFHYCPKAGKRERGQGNNHPTVKPLSLLRYLARLTRPPDGGIVLDPFGGSGTTALAAIAEGRDYIIIEKEPEYAELCRRRIAEYSGTEIAPVEVKVESDVVKQMSLW